MKRLLFELKDVSKSIKEEKEKQKIKTLDSFFPKDEKRDEEIKESIEIIVDNRERASQVLRNLSKMGFQIHLKQLQIADYVLSSLPVFFPKYSSRVSGDFFAIAL